jgi:hypothetical protein
MTRILFTMSYVFRLPREIVRLIELYVMGFGTKLARLFRKKFKTIPTTRGGKETTCWRFNVTQKGRIRGAVGIGIGSIELQLAYIKYEEFVPRTLIQKEIHQDLHTYLKELTEGHVKKKYNYMTAPNTFGTPTAIIIRKNNKQ